MYAKHNAMVPKGGSIPQKQGIGMEGKVRYIRIQLAGWEAEPVTALRDKRLELCLMRARKEIGSVVLQIGSRERQVNVSEVDFTAATANKKKIKKRRGTAMCRAAWYSSTGR